jgi:catechol 2,3-dioxygenase-like lactoylglutathione lyase family enzyme
MEFYSKTLGIGPWQTLELAPDKSWVKGKPTPFRFKVGLCQWGNLQFELIELIEGDIPHKWFMDEKGEAMHHLAFAVDNYDEWMAYLQENDAEVLLSLETEMEGMGHVRAAYVQPARSGGVIFELVEFTQSQAP